MRGERASRGGLPDVPGSLTSHPGSRQQSIRADIVTQFELQNTPIRLLDACEWNAARIDGAADGVQHREGRSWIVRAFEDVIAGQDGLDSGFPQRLIPRRYAKRTLNVIIDAGRVQGVGDDNTLIS